MPLERCGRDKQRIPFWKCVCDCGNTVTVRANSLRQGRTRSCGCLYRDNASLFNRRHGHTKKGSKSSPTYISWVKMKGRCYKQTDSGYYLYGARGISVCSRWFDFVNFLADMGERPIGTTIDRLNPAGHYMPSNCRWATPKQQAETNRRYINPKRLNGKFVK